MRRLPAAPPPPPPGPNPPARLVDCPNNGDVSTPTGAPRFMVIDDIAGVCGERQHEAAVACTAAAEHPATAAHTAAAHHHAAAGTAASATTTAARTATTGTPVKAAHVVSLSCLAFSETPATAEAKVDGYVARSLTIVARYDLRTRKRLGVEHAPRSAYHARAGQVRGERRTVIQDAVAVHVVTRGDVEGSAGTQNDERVERHLPGHCNVAADEGAMPDIELRAAPF